MKKVAPTDDQILSRVRSVVPDFDCVILTGSYVNEKRDGGFEDIDLIVITDVTGKSYTEKITYKDFSFDLAIVPSDRLNFVLANDVLSLRGSFIDMIRNGRVIFDRYDMFEGIKAYIEKFIDDNYQSIDCEEFSDIVVKIDRYSNDIIGLQRDNIEYNFILFEISQLFLRLVALQNKLFIGKSKHWLRSIKKSMPEFHKEFEQTLSTALRENSPEEFFSFTNRHIRNLKNSLCNGLGESYDKKESYYKFIIQINNCREKLSRFLIGLDEVFEKNRLSYKYLISNTRLSLIIKDENRTSLNSILKLIHMELYKEYKVLKVCTPTKFEVSLSGLENLAQQRKVFISNFTVLKNQNNENRAIHSIYVIEFFLNKYFENSNMSKLTDLLFQVIYSYSLKYGKHDKLKHLIKARMDSFAINCSLAKKIEFKTEIINPNFKELLENCVLVDNLTIPEPYREKIYERIAPEILNSEKAKSMFYLLERIIVEIHMLLDLTNVIGIALCFINLKNEKR